MNLLFLAVSVILALNVILLILLLVRRRSIIYILKVLPEHLPEKRAITPDELREAAWESWSSAHPAASQIEQQRTQWIIEKKVRDIERRNRQPNPFADTQRPTKG